MKKQINLTIKAHLVRGAFYLLLLLAVCAIPFALAQRSRLLPYGTRGVPDLPRISQFPQKTSGGLGAHVMPTLRPPKAPQVVLYDQYDNLGSNATADETFSDLTGFDSDLADDFVVPAGQTWNVQSIDADGTYFNGSGPANSFNVFIYTDNAGLPGTQIFSTLNQPVSQVGTTFTVTLSPAAVLTPGTYWIEIQANMTFSVGGQWGWTDRTVQSNSPAAWQNPGGGFATSCTTWGQRGATCNIDPGVPDQVYRINGTIGGGSCSWSAGPNLPNPPVTLVRAVGVFFTDGNFYSVGGRSADTAGSDFQHVLKFNTTTNTWSQQGVTLPDNSVNNMACGVLTVSGTPFIYCVGGNFATGTTGIARVFFYDPITDTVTSLTSADDWPGDASGTILPGGFAVANDKLYILGGFNINVASTNQIWQFDPTAGAGLKWTQMTNAPEGIMYAPTAAINGIIYVGGASDFQGGLVVDTTNSFSFDPVANTIGSIAPIPRATGETRGLNFCNTMHVMGGGRVAPNPSNEVDVYDPVSNTWSTDLPFMNARRNFPTDTDGTNHIWLAGGYEPTLPAGDMEIFSCPVSPCASASPTPTATATATATATPTATATATPPVTPTPTATPPLRSTPTPRPRPTPAPRPTP